MCGLEGEWIWVWKWIGWYVGVDGVEVGEGLCVELPTRHGYLSPVTSIPMVSHWLDCLYLYLYILISEGSRLQLLLATKHSLLTSITL